MIINRFNRETRVRNDSLDFFKLNQLDPNFFFQFIQEFFFETDPISIN